MRVVLAVAAVVGTSLALLLQISTAASEGSSAAVRPNDLAMMVLPLDTYGPDFAHFRYRYAGGFDEADELRAGELYGYALQFITPSGDPDPYPFFVSSKVMKLDLSVDPATFIADFVNEAQQGEGGVRGTFEVAELPGAFGLGEGGLRVVIFPMDSLVGFVTVVRLDGVDVEDAVKSDALVLAERMKLVIEGTITALPRSLPPDANCDGRISAIDAALVLQRGGGLISALPCELLGDADQDGSIGAVDAALILQDVAGYLDLPCDAPCHINPPP